MIKPKFSWVWYFVTKLQNNNNLFCQEIYHEMDMNLRSMPLVFFSETCQIRFQYLHI